METISAEDQFSIEYQLLEIYHQKKKARFSAKPKQLCQGWPVRFKGKSEDCGRISTRTPVPASANTDAFEQVADKLSDIVDSGPSAQDQVVTASDVIQRLVELLKEYGDQVNEKIMKDPELLRFLQRLVSYNLFERLASAFIRSVVPPSKPREEDNNQKMRIAWTFEMTSRLGALDLQPMNRTMGFGAQYVHQYFAPWVQQHGGWENAFNIDENDEVDEVL